MTNLGWSVVVSHISSWPLGFSACVSNRHLQFNMFKCKLLIVFSYHLRFSPSLVFLIVESGTSIYWDAQSRNMNQLWHLFLPFLHSSFLLCPRNSTCELSNYLLSSSSFHYHSSYLNSDFFFWYQERNPGVLYYWTTSLVLFMYLFRDRVSLSSQAGLEVLILLP